MRSKIRKLLLWLLDKSQQNSKEPFAAYFTTGIDFETQRTPIEFMWNKAFIDNLNQYGYACDTEEETIELFFVATRPTPVQMDGPEDSVNSESHPRLSESNNFLKR